jgi:hypothetical protein
VLLTIVQAVPPVPREAPHNSAQAATQVKGNGARGQAKSQPAHPPAETNGNGPPKSDGSEQHSKDTNHDIGISKLPTVTVNPPKRDLADWGYWAFSGLLVIVGGFQVWLLFRTFEQVRRQADIYEQQRAQMVKAGKQTDELLETMRDTAIRELRAYVCMSSAQIGFMRERAPEIHVRIKNYGKTPAYDVRMWIGGALGPYPLAHTLEPPPTGFQMSTSTLAPDAKPYTMIFRHPEIPESAMPVLGTSMLTLYAYGEVVYRDAFGKQRSTKYRLMYGGRERAILKDVKGVAVALLKPDTEGNEAD